MSEDFTSAEYNPALGRLMRDRAISSVPKPTLEDWAGRMNELGIDPEQCAKAVEAFIANPPNSRGWPQWSEFLPYLRKFTRRQDDAPGKYPAWYSVDGSYGGDWDSVSNDRRVEIAGKICGCWNQSKMPYSSKMFVEWLSPGFLEKWESTRLATQEAFLATFPTSGDYREGSA